MIAITNPKRFFLVLLLVLIVVVVGVWMVLRGAALAKSGEVTIESGQAAQVTWQKLAGEGFTRTQWPWRYAAWQQEASAKLKAGTYHIEKGETVAQVVDRMVRGDVVPAEQDVTFPEGFTLEQIAARVAARGIGTAQAFEAAAVPGNFLEQYSFLKEITGERNLEGYLFPDTYRIAKGDAPEDIIVRLLGNFDRKFSLDLRQEAGAAGRSLGQVVTMASIIEREVLSDEDMATVSGILWKRFDEGGGLDADATIRYALSKWDGALTVKDLQVDSPYNTRRYRGLPPGPISNPGLRALIAAVRPVETDYYYYLSGSDGKTYFARTNEEHNVNKAKYLR